MMQVMDICFLCHKKFWSGQHGEGRGWSCYYGLFEGGSHMGVDGWNQKGMLNKLFMKLLYFHEMQPRSRAKWDRNSI